MIKLSYNFVNDEFKWNTFIGDPKSIADLYWQLSNNYNWKSGAKIKNIVISSLDGDKIDNILFESRFISSNLSKYYPRSQNEITSNIKKEGEKDETTQKS